MTALSADQVPEEWSVIASSYEQAFEGLSSQFAAEALRLLKVKPGERLIDVAAGTGALSLMAARAGAEVLATDFAPGMVARLRERAASARLSGLAAEVMDGQALTVPDGSFDASASVLGLIFFPDIPQGMSELKRVVRKGGRSAIVCWGDVTKLELMSLVMRAIATVAPELQASAGPPVWARLSGEDALRAQMQRAGFRDVEVTTVSGSLEDRVSSQLLARFRELRSSARLPVRAARSRPYRRGGTGFLRISRRGSSERGRGSLYRHRSRLEWAVTAISRQNRGPFCALAALRFLEISRYVVVIAPCQHTK